MHGGGGRIILSDGGGIRRNVIVVQKPSLASATTTTTSVVTVTPVSSVSHEGSVTPVTSDIIPVSVSNMSLSPVKVSSAFEQVKCLRI